MDERRIRIGRLAQRPVTCIEFDVSGADPVTLRAALAQGVRGLVPLVQVPPRAVWGAAGQARHTPAESWLGQPLDIRDYESRVSR